MVALPVITIIDYSYTAITRQWWRHLVNAYKVKADMVYLQCKNCVIHIKRFRGEFLTTYGDAIQIYAPYLLHNNSYSTVVKFYPPNRM